MFSKEELKKSLPSLQALFTLAVVSELDDNKAPICVRTEYVRSSWIAINRALIEEPVNIQQKYRELLYQMVFFVSKLSFLNKSCYFTDTSVFQ